MKTANKVEGTQIYPTWEQIENEHHEKMIERAKRNPGGPNNNSFNGIHEIFEGSIEVSLIFGHLDVTKCMQELQRTIDYCQQVKNRLL